MLPLTNNQGRVVHGGGRSALATNRPTAAVGNSCSTRRSFLPAFAGTLFIEFGSVVFEEFYFLSTRVFRFGRIDSPTSSIRCEPLTMRSMIASATVGLLSAR